jgi:hypothetical protein
MAESKTTCPEECIGWTEEHLDSRLNESYYAHQASGAESIAALIRAKAGELFARGPRNQFDDSDKIARLYRDMAELAENWAKERRKEQEKAQLRTQEIEKEEADV